MLFKADLKARWQCHLFDDYYRCRQCCDRCSAVQPFTHAPDPMSYKNAARNAPYAATLKDHAAYVRSAKELSPWMAVAGFQYETASFDIMHIVFLGIGKNHVPSCLKLLKLWGFHYVQGESDVDFLKKVSFEMKSDCKRFKPLAFKLVRSTLHFPVHCVIGLMENPLSKCE